MTDTETAVRGFLDVPDARVYYEVRGQGPLVVLVGAPMDARAFAPLAELLSRDHTVVTTDPRGILRSVVHDRDADSTPEQRADDLARLIAYVDAGPAVVFGSSGGAVSVLALAQAHPELVSTVIPHEPPLNELLPDRDDLRLRTDDIVATHLRGDVHGGWVKFLDLANIQLPPFVIDQLATVRDPQAIADADFQNAHMLVPTTRWQPDIDRLDQIPTRIVVGIGEASAGQLCERTSEALAAVLGLSPVRFPGGHTGFAEDPVRFEPRLRAVLGSS